MSAHDPVPHLRPGGWLTTLALFGSAPPPDNTRALLERLGRPQDGLDVVLVAGTNGKGSTAKLLADSLSAAGHEVGLFVSPHLQDVTERIATDGVSVPAADLEATLEEIRPAAVELGSTFFEVLTAAALLTFARGGVSWAVMEVGMGGRLDPTNALEPKLSLITKIALDHQAVLGDDLASIAREKAGVLRPGRPALTSADGPALRALRVEAARMGAELGVLGDAFAERVISSSWAGLDLELWFDATWLAALRGAAAPEASPARRDLLGSDLRPPLGLSTRLVGLHQAGNVALAATAALCLGVEPAAVRQAAAAVAWPGRLERIRYSDRWVVLDGAHNPHGAASLAEALAQLGGGVDTLLLAIGRDKDAGAMARPLLVGAKAVVTTAVDSSGRFIEAGRLAEIVRDEKTVLAPLLGAKAAGGGGRGDQGGAGVEAVTDPRAALGRALELTPLGGTLVVAGSLHLVGELRQVVTGEG